MKEDFLHYIWQFSLFNFQNCKTIEGEEISVLYSGNYNSNSGPDFLYAQIRIGNQKWVGNVEIHCKSSDWYIHNHEKDTNYDAVILHVVYEYDATVYMKNNKPLPTLELKKLILPDSLKNYNYLINQKRNWINCDLQLPRINSVFWKQWLEELFFKRLEQKGIIIKDLLNKTNNDYERVLFILLSKNFGLKVNGEAFLNLANSISLSTVKKESFDIESLEALLFGQAGFLNQEMENNYHHKLCEEYNYQKHKYNLTPLNNNQFQFFRMRPSNFPTIRIAQLCSLYFSEKQLFSKIIGIKNVKEFYPLFSSEVSEFWKEHYTFDSNSKKSNKKLTSSFIDLIIINTILPLKYVYLNDRNLTYKKDILNIIKNIKPEKNTIISKFSELNITAKNALESQALIHLKKQYCTPKYCLKCAIGKKIMFN